MIRVHLDEEQRAFEWKLDAAEAKTNALVLFTETAFLFLCVAFLILTLKHGWTVLNVIWHRFV